MDRETFVKKSRIILEMYDNVRWDKRTKLYKQAKHLRRKITENIWKHSDSVNALNELEELFKSDKFLIMMFGERVVEIAKKIWDRLGGDES